MRRRLAGGGSISLIGRWFFTMTFCASWMGMPGFAQTGKGTISGRVTDASGAVLRAARVEVQPGGASTFTDDQGQYVMPDLPAGEYQVTTSYVGFNPQTKRVVVAVGQTAKQDVILKVASTTEEVIVTAERGRGEAEAINRTLESDNILQVLPVEVITSLPNTNIADALGRMPSVTLERDEGEGKYVQIRGLEPRLANVTIDGVNVPSPESGVRQIKLDVIPANLVDSVEINKTLSANQDGDAVAGSVNLVTKTPGEKATLYLNGIGGYTPIIGGRSLYEVDGTVGKRFGASKRLGVIFGGSYDWNGRGIDDVEPVPSVVQCSPGPGGCNENFDPATATNAVTYPTEDIREYRYYRTRYGFTGAVDYKLGDVSGLYARFLYSHFNNFGDRWVYTPTINTFETPTQGGTDGNMTFGAQIRRPVEVIGSLVAGGKHAWNRWVLAYDLSVARASSEDHGYASADFAPVSSSDPLNNVVFNVDTSSPLRPKLVAQNGAPIYDPSHYNLQDLDIGQSYSPQLNLQAGFSTARTYDWGGHFGTFEFGAKVRNAHKFEDSRDPVYLSVDNPGMSSFLGTFTNANYYDKHYTLGPTVDYSKVTAYFTSHGADPNFFTQDVASSAQNSFPNNYDLVERISAGYVMNSVNFGRLRLQTGLRFEGTNENVLGYQVLFDSNGNLCGPGDTDPVCAGATNPVLPVRRTSSYLDALPSVQLRFRLPHDAAIRASYGRGISRPNYSDLPPTFNYQGNNNEVDVGNPNLKPSLANNYDLLYEQSLKPLGLLQAGFFFKQLSNPIYESVKSQLTPTLAQQYGISPTSIYVTDGWDLARPLNGKSATVYGFEISYQQHLSFLPGALGGFGLAVNYGYTHSSTAGVPLRTDTPALQRQAPNTWNISPTYDRWRVSARLGISHNDANIFSYNYQNLNSDGTANNVPLGIKGPNGDTYLYAHTQVDAQASIRMYRGLQLIVAGLNLTNEVFGFYNGSTQFSIQREYYKPSYMFGLRYTLSNEPR